MHLVKKRVFVGHIIFLSITLVAMLVFVASIDKHLYLKSLIFIVGVTAIFFSIFYKIHKYILVIKLDNLDVMTVKTGHRNKTKIKKFYYSLLKIISTSEILIREKIA